MQSLLSLLTVAEAQRWLSRAYWSIAEATIFSLALLKASFSQLNSNVNGTPLHHLINVIMETLAAVGLVGNIFQFIDFSCKLFEQANSIYHSHCGASQDAQDLETIIGSLQNLSSNLQQDTRRESYDVASTQLDGSGSPPAANQIDNPLEKLAKGCQSAGNELLIALQDLKAREPGSKWSSFRSSLKLVWREGRINAMKKRLDNYRSQLAVELQAVQL